MSGRPWGIIVSLLAAGGLLWVFIGDLNLDDFTDDDPPPMVVEMDHVTLRRGLSGDLWLFEVDSVRRTLGVSDLEGIEGRRKGPDGSVWTLRSPTGEYLEEGDRLHLQDGNGTFEEREESFLWRASRISWGGASSDVWMFPDGLEVSGDRYSLSGRRGEAHPSGRVFLEEGVMEWWNVE
ncbi:hypothetical protein [Dethiosulfovibrio salsuginis]|uniref:LPS export ABC transporter protein LptC n=1 Tax=Dethiosulfovibrio salsuginis TaxID=561720 RepID=A0A1X7K563_9BACT|nr:hypothetical protein [Dethiosulfovibrio salsuginis]SMG36122.1 hypothetical protein SAMN06275492_12119 [Dethiosulfovibrio salsuginis]